MLGVNEVRSKVLQAGCQKEGRGWRATRAEGDTATCWGPGERPPSWGTTFHWPLNLALK